MSSKSQRVHILATLCPAHFITHAQIIKHEEEEDDDDERIMDNS
jgi:hypothetical protein